MRGRTGDAPKVICAGSAVRVTLVAPALMRTACRPFVGAQGRAAPPFTEIVALCDHSGIRT